MSITAKRKKPLNPRRPFARKVLERARQVAADYQVVLWHQDERWFGRGLEMAFVFGDGPTPQAALADAREALVTTVASMIEEGETPPAPAVGGEQKRDQQVSIRLSRQEKLRVDALAKARGFKGAADYLRARALAG